MENNKFGKLPTTEQVLSDYMAIEIKINALLTQRKFSENLDNVKSWHIATAAAFSIAAIDTQIQKLKYERDELKKQIEFLNPNTFL